MGCAVPAGEKIILRKDLLAIARVSGGDLVELSSEPAMPELSTRSLLETVATPASEKGTET